MAELNGPAFTPQQPAPAPPLPAPDIPAATQLLAIAWMRWRMFANGFRRRQTGPRQVAGLVLSILLRAIIWPMFAFMGLGPAVGAGVLAYMAVADHHPQRLAPLLAGVAVLWQFIAVNGVSMAATLSNFDPASLLRFPLRFGRYLVLRLLLGLLTPSTIIGCLALFSAAAGIAIADLSLAPAAVAVLAIYAAMNIFFSRMIAVWLERWLATRRAREIFGALMAVFFVSFEFLNFRHPAGQHLRANDVNWMMNFLHGTNRVLAWLPPGFATGSIVGASHSLARLAQLAALLAWTGAFFAAFALRLHKQFLGEYLSEGAPRADTAATRSRPSDARTGRPRHDPALAEPGRGTRDSVAHATEEHARTLLSPAVAACLRKEWMYLRGNGNQIIAMVTPLVFVFLFARGVLAHHPSFLLSGSVGYAVLGLLAGLYNIFGADGAGVQFYLLAPVRMRDVVLAKNIASLALLAVEAVLAWGLVSVLAAAPLPPATQLSAFFWIVFMLFANLTLGTLRSIQAPRKITLGQARQMRTPAANKTSGLLVLAVLLGSILLQVPVTLLCRHFHNAWLAVAIFAPLAAASVSAYGLLLNHADRLILTHRDTFAQELCGS